MPVAQQENFRQMIDSVAMKFPVYDTAFIKRDINDHLRAIIARRPWSGLIQYAVLGVPASYTIGTVTVTASSSVVTGVSTAWPTNDLVNTTLSTATADIGIIDLTPASMTGIQAGRWLLLDGGNAGEEAVYVISTTATTFRARCTKTHSAAITITCSSLAGRQLKTGSNAPFFTVTGVSSTTRLILDKSWVGATAATQSYSISAAYVSLGQNIKQILTMVNMTDTYRFAIDVPKGLLDAMDGQRSRTQSPHALSFHETDPAGSPLYEIYPRPTSVAQFPYFYVKEWTPLDDDNDLLPNGIRSDVLVMRARAEAASWPGHKIKDGGIYYDPKLADSLMNRSELEIERMKVADDSTNIMTMFWQYSQWRCPFGGGPQYDQSHDYLSWGV